MNLLELMQAYQNAVRGKEDAEYLFEEMGVDPIIKKAIITSFDQDGNPVDAFMVPTSFHFEVK